MDDVASLLVKCFQGVFPGLDSSTILGLSQATYAPWDSLASVALVRVIEEQFGIQLDLFDLEQLDSFVAMEAYIRSWKIA